MKKLLLIYILILFLPSSLQSQELINGNLNSNCIGNGFTAPTCVSDWYASHGTPNIEGNITKNTWASLTSTKDKIEGVFTNYEFLSGKSYRISFKMKITTSINAADKILASANVRTSNELNANFQSQNPPLPNKSELVWTKNITKGNPNWENISISYTPKENNSQLWFYTSLKSQLSTSENKYVQFEIDDISISTSGQKRVTTTEKNESNLNQDALEYIFPKVVQRNDYLNVRINSGEVREIQIIDLAGSIFKNQFTILNKNYINLKLKKDIYEGNYIVKIIKKDNSTITKNLTIK
ncbi:hypothetical protein FIA58_020260 [Flavobacterium jejuense]|uniref:Secretion system C-terminal sorting domain-containing protein n=1 Tax=Flavobacterium jejuense TaxID=1544455 RepID=A0ABX0IZQ0_9FLAO|nr:hypothetical protein [Flavobacterium jejuense]NHN28018.1 hypothetical protein [Flavobacterium jejuense]